MQKKLASCDVHKLWCANNHVLDLLARKGVLEIADALYGVTMRGDGVSEVISQRIREVDAVS